jgi:hypothetical protein
MTLLDEENQKWYCHKDDELYYAKEDHWGPWPKEDLGPKWNCAKCGRVLSLSSFKTIRDSVTCDCGELYEASKVVQETARRFRANMKGCYGIKSDGMINRWIHYAESAATPQGVLDRLNERVESIVPMASIVLGGPVGSMVAKGQVAKRAAKAQPSDRPVPLIGALTPEQEALTQQRLLIRKTWKDDLRGLGAVLLYLLIGIVAILVILYLAYCLGGACP